MKRTDSGKEVQVAPPGPVPRSPKPRSGIFVGVGLALLVVIAGVIIMRTFINTAPRTQTTQTSQSPSHHIYPSVESPASHHRAQSTVARQTATTSIPWGIAVDRVHGFVWVAEPGCEVFTTCKSAFASIIGKYSLSDGTLLQNFYEIPGFSNPLFVAVDASGKVWFTEPNSDALGELDPAHGIWNQWKVTRGAVPYNLTIDKQGNIWFTEFKANKIAFFNPQTHQIVENPIPTPDSNPYGITTAPNGTIWFTENRDGVGKIGSFTPTPSGTVTIVEHAVATQQPHLITADKAGNIWYSEAFAGSIGEFNPTTGTNRNFPVSADICVNAPTCPGTHISGITVDERGYIWFDDSLSARVGYLIPSTGKVVTKRLSQSNAHPHDGLAVDGNDTVWFTEQDVLQLAMWPGGIIK
jgi:virginiamycin B lyase